MIRSVALRNFAREGGGGRERGTKGHKTEYEAKVYDELQKRFRDGRPLVASWHNMQSVGAEVIDRLARSCSLAQNVSYAGREDVGRVVNGGLGRLLQRDFAQVPAGGQLQRRRAQGYATKLQAVVRDIQKRTRLGGSSPREKTLVMVHRQAGWKLLLRMMSVALGGEQHVRGFPPARTFSERQDESLKPLLGLPHDETDPCCRCALCRFNAESAGSGPTPAAPYVSFLGVRRSSSSTYRSTRSS